MGYRFSQKDLDDIHAYLADARTPGFEHRQKRAAIIEDMRGKYSYWKNLAEHGETAQIRSAGQEGLDAINEFFVEVGEQP